MAVSGKVAAGFFGLLILGGLTHACEPDQPTASSATAPASASGATAAAPAAASASAVPVDSSSAASSGPAVTVDLPNAGSATIAHVTRVVDGDTFEIAGGQKVRVLGVDSCEAGTYGGRLATASAQILEGQDVYLATQPGVSKDRYGRLLRYVATSSGSDFGQMMVSYDHTGVYAGRNDASPAYVAKMRAADPNGRTCTAPAPDTNTTTSYGSNDDDGGHVYVPHRDHGLPDGALTGGYCARKWWC